AQPEPRAPGRRPRPRLGSAGRGGADGDAPPAPAQSLRTAQGADPRPGHHRAVDAALHRIAGTARRRPAPAAGDDARRLHRPGREAGRRGLSVRLLLNIDVPDLAAAEAFYVAAFGLAPARRFGDAVVELVGAEAPIYLLRK